MPKMPTAAPTTGSSSRLFNTAVEFVLFELARG
jgi:hypothetical protein